MASLVLTDSSQLTSDSFKKLPDQTTYPYAEPDDLQKHKSAVSCQSAPKKPWGYCAYANVLGMKKVEYFEEVYLCLCGGKVENNPQYTRAGFKPLSHDLPLLRGLSLSTTLVTFPLLMFKLFGKPFERGFFCDDESLKHPFKDSTVPSVVMYVLGILMPASLMILTEFIHYRQSNGQVARIFMGRTIPPWIWNSYKVIGVFAFGVACSHLTTDVAKYSLGRLRPHFFAVCQPNIDCTDTIFKNVYIENFQCNSTNQHRIKEMRLSFPSGHSSFSACTMVYFAMYLQARMTWRGSKLLRHFLQYMCLLLAIGTALSRISDYKHHWSDVLAGIVQGSLAAIITVSIFGNQDHKSMEVVFVSDLFSSKSSASRVPTEADPPSRYGNNQNNQIC
uniref:Phosphatidic acid phosphatase type 2/haloperoxidase domain-containing protein n=1 Tax=Timema cristinae TaxID=61476 RepID=A0A7R9D7Q1_TIMCR|nr:unnamed protein product [Timema cristinae]